ncbi:hybrid sensor histidine kinase/response regulator transcription factor [Alkalitalea saponilacus]|uniref:histidine kinase n=1 Tax=Alkalitalea saponilacus TaxID=889453 RepID=A0A1T5BE42_9BACT|nr:two-component regulator propeller domain-containing protein [Alkalitalea saponilacus]ASB49714.1 hypothetical protein CDL62_11480 [Alkalitalea saponilacus]SKB45309.1 Two component regulator propeller [Alkalitalea saponilacus]
MKFIFTIILSIFFQHTVLSNLSFKSITSNNGLSSSRITSIVQDTDGFIWIGTEDGLTKYDGSHFHIYKHDPENIKTISSNQIYTLFIDKKGDIWVGTSNGINVYNRKNDSFIRMNHLPRENIYAIAQDLNGHIYIGAHNFFFLNSIDQQLTEFFPDPNSDNSISHGIVNTIYIDCENNIWVGTKHGLNLFIRNLGAFKTFLDEPDKPGSITGNDIRSITRDEQGRLWIGTNKGLNKGTINENDIIFKNFIHNPSNDSSISEGAILSLHLDNHGYLWVGTQNGGLNRLKINSNLSAPAFERYQYRPFTPNSITNNTIQTIYEDFQENIWIGTYAGGINIYKKNAKQIELHRKTPEKKSSVINNHVNTFLEDDHFIWIGTEGGLSRYNKETEKYTHYVHEKKNSNSIGSNAVWDLAENNNDQIWIGTWGGGLNLFDKEKGEFTIFLPSDNIKSLNSANIFAILPEENGDLWIGTMGGGLNHYNKSENTFTHYTIDNSSIKTNFVEDIIKLSDSVLLLANVNGVTKFNIAQNIFTPVTLSGNNQDVNVYALYKDSKNNIWIGTEAGLHVINEELAHLGHYSIKDGLPHNAIKSIKEDRSGNLWLGTNMGISKFTKAVLLPSQPILTNLKLEDGLQGNEFNRRSALLTREGIMYFGGINGFNRFHPDSIRLNPFIPDVEIVDFYISGNLVDTGTEASPLQQHISYTEEITLKKSQNNFGFRFTAFNYISPENNLFAYKLDGFEDQWNYITDHRETHYTNINPGRYTFKVKAANNDGLWNDNYRKIDIVVLPAWWQTHLAYIGYIIILLLLIVGYKRYSLIEITQKTQLQIEHFKHKKQEEINQAKLNFFTNLSHEIRTPLTLIKEPVEDLIKDSQIDTKIKESLIPTQKNIQRLLDLINQILDFRRIDTGGERLNMTYSNINNLINDIINAFKSRSNKEKHTFRLISEKAKLYAWFDYEKMTTIIYNLISNAVKYSPEGGSIEIRTSEIMNVKTKKQTGLKLFRKRASIPHLEIKISDTGCGIPKKEVSNVFRRYYRIPINERKSEGTGIGLDITKQYIELHNGKIWVDSTEGKGSCFAFQIPVNHQMEQLQQDEETLKKENVFITIDETTQGQNKSVESASDAYERSTVLIVEDNTDLLNHIANKLNIKYHVITANNGKEGLEYANEINPDIIVTDIMMPLMDGFELIRLLKSDISTSHIPIIALTAKANEEDQIKGVQTGADAYITKPFSTEILVTYINRLINTRNALIDKFRNEIHLKPTDITITNTDQLFVEKLLDITNKFLSDPEFSVEHLSSQLNMSYRSLARKIKALTDQTAIEFIRTMRLKRAAELLSSSNLTVNEISTQTGFNDPAYFSRCFRDEFKTSPTDYQKENKQKKEI